ncbi:MAG: glycosyltransferase [Candidatus Amulumruptor caecigallinarius]|nr:glycosyltransferase [Candidatus Amulumruptor caecigallinarius]MCM1396411.1 glycosyltransferase [Candidatus Amulumruptor caecigallinarius]MCM1453532.1 glycosyltransferase [bacterium]
MPDAATTAVESTATLTPDISIATRTEPLATSCLAGVKISIVTPTLDSAVVLTTALQSVLAQSHPSVQHIIVDGGSSDGTLALVEAMRPAYEARGYELTVVPGPDNGLYDAMNKGLRAATGDVIGILGSDDFLSLPSALELISDRLEADPELDAVYADIDYVCRHDTSTVVRTYSSAPFRRPMMLFGFQPPHPTVYCRRRVYDRVGEYDARYVNAGDFDFILRAIFKHRITTAHIPQRLVTMRTGGTSDRSVFSHLTGLWEHQLAYIRCRVPSCIILDSAQLLYKLFQVRPRWRRRSL